MKNQPIVETFEHYAYKEIPAGVDTEGEREDLFRYFVFPPMALEVNYLEPPVKDCPPTYHAEDDSALS